MRVPEQVPIHSVESLEQQINRLSIANDDVDINIENLPNEGEFCVISFSLLHDVVGRREQDIICQKKKRSYFLKYNQIGSASLSVLCFCLSIIQLQVPI